MGEPTVSVIIPAFNEAPNLEVILPKLPKVHQVILVDGNSTDNSIERAQAVMPDIEVVQQTRRGKGNALACGFERATGDIIVMLDADGSADPAEIERFVEALKQGADFAKGTRFALGGGSDDITLLRRSGNYFLNLLANTILGTRYTDLCYGYNAFWRRILPNLDLEHSSVPQNPNNRLHWGDGFEIEAVINSRVALSNLAIKEVPSFEFRRIHGESNLNTFRDGFRVLNALMKERYTFNTRKSEVTLSDGSAAIVTETVMTENAQPEHVVVVDASVEMVS
jgi:glycosyltransferase involved in cell wall biosynthesis